MGLNYSLGCWNYLAAAVRTLHWVVVSPILYRTQTRLKKNHFMQLLLLYFHWSKAFPPYGGSDKAVMQAIDRLEKDLTGYFYAGNFHYVQHILWQSGVGGPCTMLVVSFCCFLFVSRTFLLSGSQFLALMVWLLVKQYLQDAKQLTL